MGCGSSASAQVAPSIQNRPPSSHSKKSIASHSSAKIIKPSTPQKKVKNPSIYSESATNEEIIIVWADANIDQSKKLYNDSITKLQRITSAVYTCSDCQQCLDYVDNITDKKIFLIVSIELGEEIVPLVHDKPQIESIYIFSTIKRQRVPWAHQWSQKVKEILFDMETIFQKIKFDSGQVGDLTSITIIRRMDLPSLVANELDQSYMYTQLLKEVLLEMKYDSTAKSKLVEYCRTKYVDSTMQLGLIDEFDRDYHEQLAIHWYTRESFLYVQLNRGLRTQDIESIMKMGFYMHDLHTQIVIYYEEQRKSRAQHTFAVYRGQAISHEELEKIKTSQGGLLSFNSFLSTSLDEKIALTFCKNASKNPNAVIVFFNIEVDPKMSQVPYAFVGKHGKYDEESEVLFSMHTIFRILGCEQINNRFWQVNLSLTNANDPELKAIADHIRKSIGSGTPQDKLGHLMLLMDEVSQAEEIYEKQLGSANKDNWRRQAHLNHQMGYVYTQKGDFKTALSNYVKALKT